MHPDPKHIAIAAALVCAALAPARAAKQPAGKPPAPAAATSSAPAPPAGSGRLITFDTCTRVLEGDLIEGEKTGQIRLIGVIAPAKGEPGWRESLDYTRGLVAGKQIKVEICGERPNDYRDRLRAVVFLPDATNLNTKLLRAGAAKLLDHKPCHVNVGPWQRYEDDARKARLGLWAGSARREETRERPARESRRSGSARVRIRPQR